MSENKIYRIWKHISIDETWLLSDTSILDDIKDSWFDRREILQNNSKEYEVFLLRLKREHAIETGIIERLYDLREGITETFIKEGFVQSYLSHGDTNIPESELMAHLHDHLEAVDFIFDVVRENRLLTTGFIKDLHALVTRNQKSAEGRDQFGNRLKIPLIRGKYKERENNPTRSDGTKILYCPPDHVDSEMDNLVGLYNQLIKEKIHPLIISTWLHHAFTTIHPFQDGNGRVARLLTSLIFIKFDYFPFTVLRGEAKVKYITALELADQSKPQDLINYFAEVQKRNIQQALNVKEVTSKSLEEVQRILVEKLEDWQTGSEHQRRDIIEESRASVFDYCKDVITKLGLGFGKELNGNAKVEIASFSFDDNSLNEKEGFYNSIINYSNTYGYYFNRILPQSSIIFRIELSSDKIYELVISIHHYGYDDSALAIGAYIEFKSSNISLDRLSIPIEKPPHVISILKNNIESKKKNILIYIEEILTLFMTQIINEM